MLGMRDIFLSEETMKVSAQKRVYLSFLRIQSHPQTKYCQR